MVARCKLGVLDSVSVPPCEGNWSRHCRSHLISAVELGCWDTLSLFSRMLFFFLPVFLSFPQRNFEPGSPSNDDRQLHRPLASLFFGELFTLGHGAHRFVAIAQWFVHLS